MHLLGKNYAEIRHFFCYFNQDYAKVRHLLGKFNVLILIFGKSSAKNRHLLGKSSAKLGNKKVFDLYDRMLVIVSYKRFYVNQIIKRPVNRTFRITCIMLILEKL